MAIIGINSLEEITKSQLGENDMIPVYHAESGEAKKININSLGGGGSEDFIVTFELDISNMTATANKTIREIAQAYNDGKRIIGKVEDNGVTFIFYMTSYYFQPDSAWNEGNSGLFMIAYSDGGVCLVANGNCEPQYSRESWSLNLYTMNSN